MEHFCDIILKSNNWPMRRWRLQTLSILRSGDHFVQWSRTILAFLVKGRKRKISVKLFWNWSTGLGDVIERFFFFLFLALVAILFSGAERF